MYFFLVKLDVAQNRGECVKKNFDLLMVNDMQFVKKRKCERKGVKNNKKYTANVYRALWDLCRFSMFWGNPVSFTNCREIL